jgi:hypothetical protein
MDPLKKSPHQSGTPPEISPDEAISDTYIKSILPQDIVPKLTEISERYRASLKKIFADLHAIDTSISENEFFERFEEYRQKPGLLQNLTNALLEQNIDPATISQSTLLGEILNLNDELNKCSLSQEDINTVQFLLNPRSINDAWKKAVLNSYALIKNRISRDSSNRIILDSSSIPEGVPPIVWASVCSQFKRLDDIRAKQGEQTPGTSAKSVEITPEIQVEKKSFWLRLTSALTGNNPSTSLTTNSSNNGTLLKGDATLSLKHQLESSLEETWLTNSGTQFFLTRHTPLTQQVVVQNSDHKQESKSVASGFLNSLIKQAIHNSEPILSEHGLSFIKSVITFLPKSAKLKSDSDSYSLNVRQKSGDITDAKAGILGQVQKEQQAPPPGGFSEKEIAQRKAALEKAWAKLFSAIASYSQSLIEEIEWKQIQETNDNLLTNISSILAAGPQNSTSLQEAKFLDHLKLVKTLLAEIESRPQN